MDSDLQVMAVGLQDPPGWGCDFQLPPGVGARSPSDPALGPRPATPLTCDQHLVEGPVGLAGGLSRHIVTQANGGQRDEAEVEGVQEAPGLLKVGKDGGRHQEADGHHDRQQGRQVPAGHLRGVAAPAPAQPGQGRVGEQRQALGRGGQQQHGGRHAQERKGNAEGLAPVGQRRRVPVACGSEGEILLPTRHPLRGLWPL